MKRISLEQLMKESRKDSYLEQYQYICEQIEQQKIKAVKNSLLNGKKPALHLSYWRIEPKPDYREQIEELQFQMVPAIRTDYYLKHLDVYQKEEKWVKLLNRYFLKYGEMKQEPVSVNERSFQIWGREKFLQKEQGKQILTHCGVTLEQLNVYHTTEPLAYYSCSKEVPQTILILENKDTFYSMRKYLLNGRRKILGETIGTVIYGAGKGILRSFEDFGFCVESYINAGDNRILYFGDLDYEGIGIYERLEELFGEDHILMPFVAAYEKMLQKSEICGMDFLPETSEKQNRNISGTFFRFFPDEITEKIQKILTAGKYIPQEIINITDFTEKE